MLQAMQAKVQEEGKKEEELFDKFMCYCKTGGENLQSGIEAAKTKIPALESSIEKTTAQKAQLEQEIAEATKNRKAAVKTMNEAMSLRHKEEEAFLKESAESKANIKSMGKAIE